MNVRSLIPWRRNRGVDRNRFGERGSPFPSFHREMNRMFDDFLRGLPGRSDSTWPQIEVSETDDEVKVVAELAGVGERDVDMTLQDGVLTLKGHKRLEKNGTVYSERWEGAFERIIPVGQDVNPDKVKALFRNGVLTIRLPKQPEAQRRTKRISLQ